MSPRGWGRSSSRIALVGVAISTLLARTVSANPISTPFDYALEIAFFNFPINGFLLLGLYVALVKRGANAAHFGTVNFFFLFLSCTAIISFTGGMVDSAAYMTYSLSVYVIATTLIGMIALTVAYRYLRLDLMSSMVVGGVFFTVNLACWSLLANDHIIDASYYHSGAIIVLALLFLAAMALVSWGIHGRTQVRRYGSEAALVSSTLPGLPPEYPVRTPRQNASRRPEGLVAESIVSAAVTFFLLVFSYGFLWY